MKQDDEKTEALSLRIPTWLKAALQDLADADRRQLSQYVRLALEAHVESKKSFRGAKSAERRKHASS